MHFSVAPPPIFPSFLRTCVAFPQPVERCLLLSLPLFSAQIWGGKGETREEIFYEEKEPLFTATHLLLLLLWSKTTAHRGGGKEKSKAKETVGVFFGQETERDMSSFWRPNTNLPHIQAPVRSFEECFRAEIPGTRKWPGISVHVHRFPGSNLNLFRSLVFRLCLTNCPFLFKEYVSMQVSSLPFFNRACPVCAAASSLVRFKSLSPPWDAVRPPRRQTQKRTPVAHEKEKADKRNSRAAALDSHD